MPHLAFFVLILLLGMLATCFFQVATSDGVDLPESREDWPSPRVER